MTWYSAGNRRQEFLTHLAARSLYRTDGHSTPAEAAWRHWTLPSPDAWSEGPSARSAPGTAPHTPPQTPPPSE